MSKIRIAFGAFVLILGGILYQYGNEAIPKSYVKLNEISASEIIENKKYYADEILFVGSYAEKRLASKAYSYLEVTPLGKMEALYFLISIKDKNGEKWFASMEIPQSSSIFENTLDFANNTDITKSDYKIPGYMKAKLVMGTERRKYYEEAIDLYSVLGDVDDEKMLDLEFEYICETDSEFQKGAPIRSSLAKNMGIAFLVLGGYLLIKGIRRILKDSSNRREKKEIRDIVQIMPKEAEGDLKRATNSGIIKCVEGSYAGAEFPVMSGEWISIGRNPKLANIVISDYALAGKHCAISYDGDKKEYILASLSINGVYLQNGEMLSYNETKNCVPGTVFVLNGGGKRHSFVLE